MEVVVSENILSLYELTPFFAPPPPDFVNKTIGDEWDFEVPVTLDLAGEDVSVKVSRSRSCQFISVDETELFIGEGNTNEVIGNCTITFSLTARGFWEEDPVR